MVRATHSVQNDRLYTVFSIKNSVKLHRHKISFLSGVRASEKEM